MRTSAALLVDDDAAIRETLHQLLEDEGYHVMEAPDGVAALDALRSTPYRMVVLLDLMMPRLDGYGVLLAVIDDAQLLSQHRYILMTAAASALTGSLLQLMLEFDVPALVKPFSVERLLTVMAEAESQLVD